MPPQLIRISLRGQTPQTGTTIQMTEGHMINAQTNHSIQTMVIDPEMCLLTIRMETVETLDLFLVFHRLRGETSHKTNHSVNQEVRNLRLLLSADLTINLRPVSHLTNIKSHKTITRRHPMWSGSLQPKIPLLKYQTFAVKLLRSPNTNSDKSQNSRLNLTIFYFATGETQKSSGLDMEIN